MSNRNKFQVTFLLLFPLLVLNCRKVEVENTPLACQVCVPIPKTAGSYTYPTPTPADLTDGIKRLAFYQISQSRLDAMNTDALLQSCLDFPLLGDILLNVGVYIPGVTKNYTESFSGLVELCKRSDAGEKIYKRYAMISPSCITRKNAGFSSANLSAFETIIGEDNVMAAFSDDLKKKIVKEAIIKYYCKKAFRYPEDYAYYNYATSAYVMAKILFNQNYQPFILESKNNPELQMFVNRLLWPENQKNADILFNIIIENANQFIQ